MMQLNSNICVIVTTACYVNIFTLVKYIDDVLLDVLVKLVIHCIYSNCLIEDFVEILADFRYRICDNCKASLLTVNVFVCNLTILACIINVKLVLLVIELCISIMVNWLKWLFTKCFDNSWATKNSCKLFVLFEGILKNLKHSVCHALIPVVCSVILVVIFALLVWNSRI